MTYDFYSTAWFFKEGWSTSLLLWWFHVASSVLHWRCCSTILLHWWYHWASIYSWWAHFSYMNYSSLFLPACYLTPFINCNSAYYLSLVNITLILSITYILLCLNYVHCMFLSLLRLNFICLLEYNFPCFFCRPVVLIRPTPLFVVIQALYWILTGALTMIMSLPAGLKIVL